MALVIVLNMFGTKLLVAYSSVLSIILIAVIVLILVCFCIARFGLLAIVKKGYTAIGYLGGGSNKAGAANRQGLGKCALLEKSEEILS